MPLRLNPSSVVATVTSLADLKLLDAEIPDSQPETRNSAAKLHDFIDVFEFRLDNLAANLDLAETVAKSLNRPVLIAARHPKEGGANDLNEENRLALLRRFLPLAQLVDVEVRTLREGKNATKILAEAQNAGLRVVASFHDFERTPENSALRENLDAARDFGADIGKIAVFADEMRRLFDLAEIVQNAQIPVSAMGMGPLGKLSRLVLARAGSVLNYGYLREANAPGQWPAEALKQLIAEL